MKKKALVGWGIGLVVVSAAGALLLSRAGAAGPSVLSRGAAGWLAARRYLERRQRRVILEDRPFDQAVKEDALILSFPWERFPAPEELDALRRHLSGGGTIVFAYSGGRGISEELVASELRISTREVRENPPLEPRRWYAYASETWRLAPQESLGPGAREVVVRAPRVVPAAPAGARILYRGGGETSAAFEFSSGRGRVIVIPADAVSNARLENPGNADLLESLAATLGESLVFDEYHHGLVAPELVADSGNARSLDLLIVQLVLLYLFSAWALGKRFGPSWEEPTPIASSTATFLLGLGALHRKLGHSADAAPRLIENAEAFDPRVSVPASIRSVAGGAGESAFVDLAKSVSKLQSQRRAD